MTISNHALYAVQYNRRVQISHDGHYQGSINSYNNWLTKLFSRMFSKSTHVRIDNNDFLVNKKSFKNFLKSVGNENITSKEIKDLQALTPHQIVTPIHNKGLMCDHIKSSHALNLTYRLASALAAEEMDSAKELMGRGADINALLCFKNDHKFRPFVANDKSRGNTKHTLIRHSPKRDLEEGLELYPPYLYAVINNQQKWADLLKAYGADINLKGHKCEFKREVLFQESRKAEFKDTYSNRKAVVYDPEKNQVCETPHKYSTFIHIWSEKYGKSKHNNPIHITLHQTHLLPEPKGKISDLSILEEI